MILEKQHCGVHQSSYKEMIKLMPDIKDIIDAFPENPEDFTWDVKVTMLMPNQYPCIPNWHFDFVPRDKNGKQDFNLVTPHIPLYFWLSGSPLTEFKDKREIKPYTWTKFNQNDEHRGTISKEFCWRCFIRATHKDIQQPKEGDKLRRHSQVYLDAKNFMW